MTGLPDDKKERIFKDETSFIPSYKFDEYDVEYDPVEYDDIERRDPYVVKDNALFAQNIKVPIDGVVKDDKIITDGCNFTFANEDRPDKGTNVHIKKKNLSGMYVKYIAFTEKQEKVKDQIEENIKRYREAVKELDNKEMFEDCVEFWDEYNIPIDYDLAINLRKSGLKRGSSGTGRANDTVHHLRVLESFKDGRLKRDKYDYLCKNSSDNISYITDENYQPSEDEKYPRKVTCNKCRDLMERWIE